MHPQGQPAIASFEDFGQGGLYQGGTGTVTDMRVVLWDYNGKMPPNSIVAIKMMFQPRDGSNNNAPVDNYWSVGPADKFQPSPDGRHIVSMHGEKVNDNSNWAFVYEKLSKSCGLQSGRLNTELGIMALVGSEFTLARMDQPKRDFGDQAPPPPVPGQAQQRKTNNQVLVPTRAVFPWERQGTGAGAAMPTPQFVPPAAQPAAPAAYNPAMAPAPAYNPAPAPAPTPAPNGMATGPMNLTTAITRVLSSRPSITASELPAAILSAIPEVERNERFAILKLAADENSLMEAAIMGGLRYDPASKTVSRA